MKFNAPFYATTLSLFRAPVHAEIDFSSGEDEGDVSVSTDEWNAGIEDEGLLDDVDVNGNGRLEVEAVDKGFIEYDLNWDNDESGRTGDGG